ncbi:MAG: DEAD/DEAH box helicase [Spirochaetales bacterium]|nr:DEAD/DEAH box helicase [Spirochaetales bacterium]
MITSERFMPDIITTLRDAIQDALGNEVFSVAHFGKTGKIEGIKIVARGDENSVPALNSYIEKGDVVIHNHPSGILSPSNADLAIASRLGDQGIGFYIIDNAVENVYVVAEAYIVKDLVKLDENTLAQILLPEGELSKLFSFYESRPSQVEMLKTICIGLNQDEICIAEAGTGVGKSMAYLIPVIKWIQENDERIVISTATINLQQQLIEKDIPLAKKILHADTKAVLVKGRGNYICRARLHDVMNEFSLFEEANDELQSIYEWALTSKTGSRSDISFYPSGDIWSRVCSEADICSGLYCLYRENCFVLRAKREAASAQLLVANHHLLFSDLSVRIEGVGHESTAVLPPFYRIVFDEAHNIESSATSFFSKSFNRFLIIKFINRIYRIKKGRHLGLLYGIKKKVKKPAVIEKLKNKIEELKDHVKMLDFNCLSLFQDDSTLYLKKVRDPAVKNLFFEPLFELEAKLLDFCTVMEDILEPLEEADPDDSVVFECKASVRRLRAIAEICDKFKRIEEQENDIFWIERRRAGNGEPFVQCTITPLHIAPVMKEAVYEPYRTVILTSATLTVNNSFHYWKSRVGLLSEEVMENQFASPFNYKENVIFCIPSDIPAPQHPAYQKYLSSFLLQSIICSEGRALVLFTSYSMLNTTYNEIVPQLNQHLISVFKQGDDDRARLLEKFKTDIGSVLFATDSFWEGVDTPGETLELLVLCKLPFRVPSDPVIMARMEDIQKNGGNPFMDYSLPEAVIKFKQGFGRLMRRKSDRGVILVLDSRIIHKQYGSLFLDSLPDINKIIAPGPEVLIKIKEFFENKNIN